MELRRTADGWRMAGIGDFDLDATMDCGQCFLFTRTEGGGWQGISDGHPLRLRQERDGIILTQTSEEEIRGYWMRYFDWERDYAAIRADLCRDPRMAECVRYAPGIRVLRQPAWESLICFILSQNNHVKRIKGIVDRLCACFGEDGRFPRPDMLAPLEEDDLAELRCGWRAAYILDAARRVSSGQLDLARVAELPIDEARQQLRTIRGVGPKVAECVLLYGMGRLEAFPLDVWMKRAMEHLFPGMTPEDFGPYAGIAQQYIFHFIRHHPERAAASVS